MSMAWEGEGSGFWWLDDYAACHSCSGPLLTSGDLYLYHREWVEDTQLWIQQVSSTPSTRMDVVHLQEQLDLKLQQRQARETGICPVRRELYSQCFGEEAWWGERCTPSASFRHQTKPWLPPNYTPPPI